MNRDKIARMLVRMAEDVDGADAGEKEKMASTLLAMAGRLAEEADEEDVEEEVTASNRRNAEDEDAEEESTTARRRRSHRRRAEEDDVDEEEVTASRRRRRALFEDEDMELEMEDPAFASKVRALKMALPSIGRRKNQRLMRFGIGMIRPNATVEDLINALLQVGV